MDGIIWPRKSSFQRLAGACHSSLGFHTPGRKKVGLSPAGNLSQYSSQRERGRVSMHPEGHGGGRAWPMVSRGTHGLDIVCEVICGLIMFVCVCAFEPSCFGKTISISMFAAAMVYSCPDLKLSIYRYDRVIGCVHSPKLSDLGDKYWHPDIWFSHVHQTL